MMALRILMLLQILDGILPHGESKISQSSNTILPDTSSLNQTSGREPLTASLNQSAEKLSSSPIVNGYETSVTSAKRLHITSSEDFLVSPTPTEDKSALTVAATGVISFIVILVVVVIILVSVVSLKFRCRHCRGMEDKQKPQQLAASYSCPDAADHAADKTNITLVSVKNLNANNNKDITKTTVTCEEQ